jgi:hypothetical protein
VFPGAVLTAVFWRFIVAVLALLHVGMPTTYLIPIAIFILGWSFVVMDMPIYMAFEGRRYWPDILWKFGLRRQRARLLRIHVAMRYNDVQRSSNRRFGPAVTNANRIYLENAIQLSDFPLVPQIAIYRPLWPTQIGNIIAEFEQYPRIKYGLDAVFFWPRIWISIDRDLREEIDNQQAHADGLLYLSLAFAIAVPIMVIYALIDLASPNAMPISPGWVIDLFFATGCAIMAMLSYYLTLHAQRHFGATFKATFDQYRHNLALDEVVELVANLTSSLTLTSEIANARNVAAWRLLRWHKVRLSGERINRKVLLP